MAKLNTVSVVAMDGGIVIDMVSFTDNEEGNLEAEAEFIRYIKENVSADMNEASEDDLLNEGYFDYGDKSVFIVHSTK